MLNKGSSELSCFVILWVISLHGHMRWSTGKWMLKKYPPALPYFAVACYSNTIIFFFNFFYGPMLFWSTSGDTFRQFFFSIIFVNLPCVPKRISTGESVAKSKNLSTILTILFFIWCVFNLVQFVYENLLNQSNSFEDVALSMDTK